MNNDARLDEFFMSEAIELAKRGVGLTSPNPYVGAVIVKNNRIIGRGFHKRCGLPHAEINAIKNATCSIKGTTMYVTLEPCIHYGRTPPCAEAIVKGGIKRVVIGEVDPNPAVNGRGINYLRRHGVIVDIYSNRDEIRSLNCGFRKWIRNKIPYIILKVASSLDGRIADRRGCAKYITSEKSREFVHFIRYISDAILVGAGTVKKDDPILDFRFFGTLKKKNVTRVILDGNLSLHPKYRVFREDGAKRIILTSHAAIQNKKHLVKALINKGVEIIPFKTKKGRISIKDILEYLGSINILYLLVEGGRDVFTDFIDSKEVDLYIQFLAPKLLGEGGYGFYGRDRDINKCMTELVLKNILSFNNDAVLFYARKDTDVYRIDRIYRQNLEPEKKG